MWQIITRKPRVDAIAETRRRLTPQGGEDLIANRVHRDMILRHNLLGPTCAGFTSCQRIDYWRCVAPVVFARLVSESFAKLAGVRYDASDVI